jgi:hypothetical protein
MRRLQTCLPLIFFVFYLLSTTIADSTPTKNPIYFKVLIPEAGYVLGKSYSQIDASNTLQITFSYLHIDYDHRMKMHIVATKNDGTQKFNYKWVFLHFLLELIMLNFFVV